MKCSLILFATAASLFGQTRGEAIADRMLAQVRGVQWNGAYVGGVACQKWTPYQLAIYATDQWSYHCAEKTGGLIQESFYYLFGEPPRSARLRIDLRPEDESPDLTSELDRILQEKLTQRFGAPTHDPEMMEIGFRHLRYGQPVAGQHWQAGDLHYFLHRNQSNQMPMGMRKGVELIVLENRLMEERAKDEFIHQVDGLGGPPRPDNPSWKADAQQTYRETIELLREAGRSVARERKAKLLLDADSLIVKLSLLLREGSAEATQLASFGVKLGGMTHDGGLDYNHDLLWRVWREFADTEAGERAFLELHQRGWNTDTGPGCPTNPDLFREVINRGEAFLTQHPKTRLRKEVLFTLAVANESWWSIAHAPDDDAFVSAPPYPRKLVNQQHAGPAREWAIRYYREVIELAPDSPEAASAKRRLPRLESGLDTGQRRFFCSFC